MSIFPGQAQAEMAVMRWVEKHPDARTVPTHIESYLNIINRYDQMQSLDTARVRLDVYQKEEIKNDLEAMLPDYSARREAEQELAVYVDQVAGTQLEPDLYKTAQALHDCRQTGAVGIKPDGGHVIAWDVKCGMVRLCPDESREETQRLSEWYMPPLMDFKKAHPTHRIFYAVFTDHNFRPGNLKTGKQYLFEKFKQWRMDQGDKLKGALVVQEDPLSVHQDWNVHLNVFLLIKGRFDYQEAREQWGRDVHFEEKAGDAESIRGALLEAIKYSAQIVPTKSIEHADQGKSDAPAMTEWPHDLWLEWWRAGKGFRRVRSYGALYGLHEKRWNQAREGIRREFCAMADITDPGIPKQAWRSCDESTRAKLRKVMTHGEPLDMSLVEWIGAVSFDETAGYRVDLVPGDNFSRGSGRTDNFSTGYNRGGGP